MHIKYGIFNKNKFIFPITKLKDEINIYILFYSALGFFKWDFKLSETWENQLQERTYVCVYTCIVCIDPYVKVTCN